ncbi:MAG TPA: bifunctional phosphoribosylaminoimidazolecarboxamide formyltransferase/IMP cyclohydrolase, partial [Myxococcaceae bacterium]|nr:bifunctional phosphoribosylaminoimidazolecarboxamide formyltransferase/IMP cyclohydrolase [Myxococcaceae bacterium]
MIALLSVSDKRGLVPFARGLVDLGFQLLSTGGTLQALKDAGLPARKVSEHTGSPEILGGRVKTLHPRIHGGLLGRPGLESDRAEMEAGGIAPISVLAVNLYPFRETVARGLGEQEILENIDIGGPAMIRAGAKNAASVTVLVDPDDYQSVLEELRYGENPHQRGAWYRGYREPPGPSVSFADVLQGKELSYNNLLDLDAALALALEFPERPAAVIIKHNTPCGVAQDEVLERAYRVARAVDEVSAFGGIVALNREVDEHTARAM